MSMSAPEKTTTSAPVKAQAEEPGSDLPESVLRTFTAAGWTLFGKDPFEDPNFGTKTGDGFPYDGWCPKCQELYPTINGREDCLKCCPPSWEQSPRRASRVDHFLKILSKLLLLH